MPEPGINDPDFNRPTTKSVRGPTGGQLARKRRRAAIKIPGEYAEFQLNDGRLLVDVLGEKFFVPQSGSGGGESLPENPLNQMPKGDPPFGGAPEGIGASSRPAMPDDDNEAGFMNLPFGREEGDMGAVPSVSGQPPRADWGKIPGRRLEQAGQPDFTSADIPDPQDRQEFENLKIAMLDAERKIALHGDRLDLYERRFKNKRIDARSIGTARRYFELRIGQQEALIARNEDRLTETRADALLDVAALSFGDRPRVEDAREDGAPAFPTARPRPATIGGGMPGGAEDARDGDGFWMFDLPLTAEGKVAKDALIPGSVYRIPDSAGGGTGQWKNGAFYNFDQKADWRLRTAADLDAYSGVSDALTPEERDEDLVKWIKAGGDFMPAAFLEEPDIEEFNSSKNSDGVRAVQGDDEVSFSLGDGPAFLTLPDDAAAVLVRNWKDFKPRLGLLSRLFSEDLPPDEMRSQIEAEVYKGIPESERGKPPALAADGTMDISIDDPYGMERYIAERRMRAFDDLVEGIRGDATDDEISELIGEFQQNMLPELMGAERFLRELFKDLIPGLNNVRSGTHFWNDLVEIEEELKEGDITGLAGNSLLLVLDGLGMIPIVGSAFASMRSGLKKGAWAVGKMFPRVDALVAQAQVWKHARQWSNLDHKIDPSRIFGEEFDKLPRKVQGWVRMKTNFAMGAAGERYLEGLLRRMDPAARGQTGVTVPEEFLSILDPAKKRIYDGWARRATGILVEDIAGWFSRRFGKQWDNFRANPEHYEFKTGKQETGELQEKVDSFVNENPERLRDSRGNAVTSVRNARIYPKQIPMELAIADAETRLGELVEKNVIDAMTSHMLLDAMRAEYKRGTKLIGLFDYAGVFVNLLASGGHRGRSAFTASATEEGDD